MVQMTSEWENQNPVKHPLKRDSNVKCVSEVQGKRIVNSGRPSHLDVSKGESRNDTLDHKR